MAVDPRNIIPNRRGKKQAAHGRSIALKNREVAEDSLKASKIELRLAQTAFFANLITKLAVMFAGATLFSTEALVQTQPEALVQTQPEALVQTQELPAAFNHPPLFLLSNWVEHK